MAYFLLVFFFLTAAVWGDSGVVPTDSKSGDDAFKFHDFRALNPEMKLKLWSLARLPPDQLENALEKWPTLSKLSPTQRDQLIQNLHDMERAMNGLALHKAQEYGLYLTPDQQAEFTKVYVQRRLEELEKIWETTLPLQKKMEDTLRQEMLQRFASPPPSQKS